MTEQKFMTAPEVAAHLGINDNAVWLLAKTIASALTSAPEAGWRDMDDPELPMDGTQFLSMQDDWGPFVTWRDDTRNYPWRFLDRDNQINGFRDGEHGPTRWTPLLPAPGEPATEQPSVKEDNEALIDEIEEIISETHDIDVTDRNYAENIVGWLRLHHPAALRALEGGE